MRMDGSAVVAGKEAGADESAGWCWSSAPRPALRSSPSGRWQGLAEVVDKSRVRIALVFSGVMLLVTTAFADPLGIGRAPGNPPAFSVAPGASQLVGATVISAHPPKLELLWLGQSAIRLTTPGGKVILLDPFLTKNPKTPAQYKNLEVFGRVDLILVTHAHADHLGDTLELAKRYHASVVAPAGLNQTLVALGALPAEQAILMNKTGSIAPLGDGIRITMVRAEHSSELQWQDPITKRDQILPGGEPVGYVIELENGFKIWDMGDTGLFSDMKFIADYYRPDLVLMPIGGHFVMSPEDAAFAARYWIHPRMVLPFHYGTFPVLTGTPEAFIKALGPGRTKVLDLKPGDKIDLPLS